MSAFRSVVRAEYLRWGGRLDVGGVILAVPLLATISWLAGYANLEVLAAEQVGVSPSDRAALMAAIFRPFELPSSPVATLTSGPWLNFAALYVSCMTVGSEYAWGTIRNVLILRPDRTRYLLAKGAFQCIVAVALVTSLVIVGTVLPLAMEVFNSPRNAGSFALGPVLVAASGIYIGVLLYSSVGLFLATLLRHAAAPLVIVAVYVVAETLVSPLAIWQTNDILRWLPRILPGNSLGGVLVSIQRDAGMVGPGAQLPDYLSGPWEVSLVAAIVWIVVFCVLTHRVLTRSDITE